MNRNHWLTSAAVATSLAAPYAYAHAPVFACTRENTMIHCEAGYSDGSSAAGRKVAVLDTNHRILFEGEVKADGTYEFTPPSGTFHVSFDGGQYHNVTLYSTDIE